jgi:hypothetical protein
MFNMDAQSEWEKLFRFMAALYRIEGVLSIEQMDLTTGDRGRLKLRLSLSLLSQAAPAGGDAWSK